MSQRILGFWASVRRHKRAILVSWDIWLALVLAAAVGVMVPVARIDAVVTQVSEIGLTVAGAILGVILAGLAIIVVFLDREYLKVLERAGGVEADFFPFWFTAALAVSTIVADTLLLLVPLHTPLPLRAGILLALWLFFWTLFATLNLVAFVGAHGVNRALQILAGERDSEVHAPKASTPEVGEQNEHTEVHHR